MPSKALRYILAGLLVLVLLTTSFASGVLAGWSLPFRPASLFANSSTNLSTPAPEQTGTPTSQPTSPSDLAHSGSKQLDQLFTPFWDAWQLVHAEYVDQPVDDMLLMQGAIRGMLEALGDPHTAYMDPSQFNQLSVALDGEYEGIGAWVDTSSDYLTIISCMPDSPAEAAGLKPGDKVIAVDGKDMTGIDGELVRKQIVGPAGTQVTLTVLRNEQSKPFEVVVSREKILTPSVQSRMLESQVAYLRLYTFGDKSTQELKDALDTLLSQKPVGLILDLRANGGGYLTTAIEVGSQFVPDGPILYEQYGNGKEQAYPAIAGGLATQIPLVVLVDEGTASASEIVAGAIQDTGRGKLVGMTTYGKGSVQDWSELKNNQGAVRITIAHWLTPNKRLIDKQGLTPDIEVKLSEEDIQNKRDSQLLKAVELLVAAQ